MSLRYVSLRALQRSPSARSGTPESRWDAPLPNDDGGLLSPMRTIRIDPERLAQILGATTKTNQYAICHQEFTDYNDVVPDHRNPKGMGGRGETTIQIISRRFIGGVTTRRDQREWTADGRLASQEVPTSPICPVFNDLPRLWFVGVS